MSASNWDTCPKCAAIRESKIAEMQKEVDDNYGKVSRADWDYLKSELEEFRNKAHTETLREDYWLGVDSDGVFRMSYSCSCEDCGFSYQFKTEQPTDAKGGE